MRSLRSAAFLVGLAAGLATAGPVDRSLESVCATECRTGDNGLLLNGLLKAGRRYEYSYETESSTALEQTDSGAKSSLFVSADVSLVALDNCRFALQLNNARLDEQLANEGRRESDESALLAESLRRNALVFAFEGGRVTKLCPAAEETSHALNIKKGILSLLQNSLTNELVDAKQDQTIEEIDVTGECPTIYSVSKGWSGDLTVLKKKHLSACRKHSSQETGLMAVPRNVARSSSIVNGTQECQQTIKNAIPQTVECVERHVVRPLSRKQKGAATVVSQKLTLRSVAQATRDETQFNYHQGEIKEQSLLFNRSIDMAMQQKDMEQRVTFAIERLVELQKGDDQKLAPGHFAELVRLFRQMDYASLKQMLARRETQEKQRAILDGLMNTYTRYAMKLTAELIQDGTIGNMEAKAWLIKASLASDVDSAIIRQFMPLLEQESVSMEAHLAISALARTFLEENNGQRNQEIRDLVNQLFSQLKNANKQNEKKILAALKAIGNIGLRNNQESLLVETARNQKLSVETRLAAVDAFRRFDCNAERTDLMNIFTDASEDAELRVAAYLNSIVCPTNKMIESVKDSLERESQGSQVASFVFTHIKNLAKRQSWTHDVNTIVSDKQLKQLELDGFKFSKNYFFEMFFDPLDMGFEIDAGAVISKNANRFYLNSTVDMFGYNVNIFDAGFRMKNDMSSLDGFVRFFGKEIMYNRLESKKAADYEWVIKAIKSSEGLQIARSMVILDTELTIPTGNGLPIAITVNATSTMSMELKANPTKMTELEIVADARAAPKSALELAVLMTVKAAPRAESGIRMVATASSSWTLDGQIKLDFTAPVLVQMNIGAPRKVSDLVDIRSNVYLVAGGRTQELSSQDARQKEHTFCTGDVAHRLTGHKVCLKAAYPALTTDNTEKTPFFLLRGATHFNVRMIKTDESFDKYVFETSLIHKQGVKDQFLFRVDTPGSQIDRQIMGRFYHSIEGKKFGVDLVSPMKKANIEGTYQNNADLKKLQMLVKVDDETKLTVKGDMAIASGRVNIYTPSLEIVMANGERILFAKSEVAFQGTHKLSGDLEIQTPYTKTIKLNGEYGIAGKNKRRVNFAVESDLIDATLMSTASYGERSLAVSAEGQYTYRKGDKQMFILGSKLADSDEQITAEANFQKNGQVILAANGKYIRQNPQSADVMVTYFGKQYSAKISHEQDTKESTLVAVAELDAQRYGATLNYNMGAQKSKMNLKIEMPNGTEKNAKIAFARNGAAIKATGMTDITGKLYSAGLSYVPQKNMYKIMADLNMDEDHFHTSGMLNMDGDYKGKFEFLHNDSKVALAALTVGRDMRRPNIKVNVVYRQTVILDASTEAVFESQGASILFAMRAPKKVNGNFALKKSGSIDSTLKIETNMDVRSQDQQFGMTSTADLAFFGRSKRANIDGVFRMPRGNVEMSLKNTLEQNSWNVDWTLRVPKQADRMIRASGTYSMASPRDVHARANFELDVEVNGKRYTVEPLSVNAEASYSTNNIDLKTEITKKSRTVAAIIFKGANTEQKSELVAELRAMDKVYSAEWTLFGRRMDTTGLKTTFAGKWNDMKIDASAEAKLTMDDAYLKAELTTPFQQIRNAKMMVQQQTVSKNNKALNVEFVYGNHFAKADLTASRRSNGAMAAELNIRTTVAEWEAMRASATLDVEPRMRLTLGFHSTKFQDNVLEIEIDQVGRYYTKGRVVVPAIYNGDLFAFEGTATGHVEKLAGKGMMHIVYRGQEKYKVNVELVNNGNGNRLIATATHNINGSKQLLKVEAEFQKLTKNSYNTKLTITKDGQTIIDIHYNAALKTENGLFAESQLDAKTTLLENLNSVWMKNKITLGAMSIRTEHEFGRSAQEIIASMELAGKYLNEEIFTADGTVKGQWRNMKGSFSADFKSEKVNSFEMSASADSHRGQMFVTKFELSREGQMIDMNGTLRLPTINHESALKLKAGVARDGAVVFDGKLERNNSVAKITNISVRVPLRGQTMEGRVAVQLPEEMGKYAGQLSYMVTKGMVDVNMEATYKRNNYAAQGNLKWAKVFGLMLNAKKNGNDMIKVQLSAEKTNTSFDISSELVYATRTFGSKVAGEWTRNGGSISMEAESNMWEKKQFVAASFSNESKTATLKMEIAQLKLNANGIMSENYKLSGDAIFNGERFGEIELAFTPSNMRGSFLASWNEKRVSATAVGDVTDGELKIEFPAGMVNYDWALLADSLKLTGEAVIKGTKYSQMVEANWADKFTFNVHFNTAYGHHEVTVELKPFYTGAANIWYKTDNKNVVVFETTWTMKMEKVSFDMKMVFNGEKQHVMEGNFNYQKGDLSANFHITCPWVSYLKGQPLTSKINVKYTRTTVELFGEFTFLGKRHAIRGNVELVGENLSGSLDINCPHIGVVNGAVVGIVKNDYVSLKITSDKLQQPIELEGKFSKQNGSISFAYTGKNIPYATVNEVEVQGNIYFGSKFGGEIVFETDARYFVKIIAEPFSTITAYVQLPFVKQTGFEAGLETDNQITFAAHYLGKKVIGAKWTIDGAIFIAGKIEAEIDFEGRFGRHAITLDYDFVRRPSAKLVIDGETIIIVGLKSSGDSNTAVLTVPRLGVDARMEVTIARNNLKIETALSFVDNKDLSFAFVHRKDNQVVRQMLKIKSAGQTLGYDAELRKNLLGSHIQVDVLSKTMLVKLGKTMSRNGQEEIKGEFAWDIKNDESKRVEIVFARSHMDSSSMGAELSIALPHLGKKLNNKLTVEGMNTQRMQLTNEVSYNQQTLLFMTATIRLEKNLYDISASVEQPLTGKKMAVMGKLHFDNNKMHATVELDTGKQRFAYQATLRMINQKTTELVLVRGVDSRRAVEILRVLKRDRKMTIAVPEMDLDMEAQMSAAVTQLTVRHGSRQGRPVVDIRVGYEIQGNTLSGSAHWRPEIIRDLKMATRNTKKQIQRESSLQRLTTLTLVSEQGQNELNEIVRHIGDESTATVDELRRAIDEDAFQLKTFLRLVTERVVKPAMNALKRVEQELVRRLAERWERIVEQLTEMYNRSERRLTRLARRAAVVGQVASAITQEVADELRELVERFDQATANNSVRRMVQRSIDTLAPYTEAAVERLGRENLCELNDNSTQLRNANCGLAYKLRHNGFGISVRLPFVASA